MKVLKISAVAMVLALSTLTAEAKKHEIDCSTCKAEMCGDKGVDKEKLKGCGDCSGLEVVDCGIAAFDAQNCQKLKKKEYTSQCKSASKMMSKGMFQAHLYAAKGNADAQAVIDGFKKLDEANLPELQDATE
jgi:hypothetical protein